MTERDDDDETKEGGEEHRPGTPSGAMPISRAMETSVSNPHNIGCGRSRATTPEPFLSLSLGSLGWGQQRLCQGRKIGYFTAPERRAILFAALGIEPPEETLYVRRRMHATRCREALARWLLCRSRRA